jgi:hypothetical protein
MMVRCESCADSVLESVRRQAARDCGGADSVQRGCIGYSDDRRPKMANLMRQWKSIGYAPLDRDVEVWVTDGVEEYCPSFLYRLTDDGWINTKNKRPLPNRFKVIFWREPK